MALTSVSLGSNIDRERNIRCAINELRDHYGDLTISPVYQTEAVGFDGDDFLNLVVCFETNDSVRSVWKTLKDIEDRIGRDRAQPKFSARTIDLDLLAYADLVVDENGLQIPRHEILQNAFVLKPLSDIMGNELHPQLEQTYRDLWLAMEQTADRIELFRLDLQEKGVSAPSERSM